MRNEVDYTPYYYPSKETRPKPQKGNKRHQTVRTRAQKVAVLVIVVCLCVTLLALDELTGAMSPSVTASASAGTTYYCVQTGVYTDRDTANYYASIDKNKASGGYVLYDGSFHVIASIYPEEHQANLIAKRLTDGGVSASVYDVTVYPALDSNLSDEEQNELLSASEFTDECYRELYELSNLLDQDNITSGELSTRLYSLKQLVTKRQGLVTNDYSKCALKLSACMGATVEIIDALGSSPTSSEIRYAYTAIIAQRL